MANPYAPPQAVVADVLDPRVRNVPAERGTRLIAAILDTLIFGAMVYLPFGIGVAVGAVAGVANPGSNLTTPAAIVGILLGFVGFLVWAWLTIKYVNENGQTIAKKIMQIKVVRSDGTPISLGRIFWLRNVVNSLLSVVPFYGLIDVLFIFAETRQCLHDKIADTVVVTA